MPRDITLADRQLLDSISANPKRPQPLFRTVDDISRRLFKYQLMTIMLHLPNDGMVERVYSSDPENYPAGGRKATASAPWGISVLRDGNYLLCTDDASIEANFPDHEDILRLGFRSILNIPVIDGTEVSGTMNMLAGPGTFSDTDVAPAKELAAYLAPVLIR